MRIGDIVQIRIPKSREGERFYKFNNGVGKVVDLVGFNGHEKCFAVILGTNEILWPLEWIIPFEHEEEDEDIEPTGFCELLEEFK